MSKTRVEFLSDGVFAIVMTLLIIEIHVPEVGSDFVEGMVHLIPSFMTYFLSFMVLSVFWLSHHAFFSFFVRDINRQLIQLNIVYLSFVALIPFSANLIAVHPHEQLAAVWYGGNLLAVGLMANITFWYARRTHEVHNHDANPRSLKQASTRLKLTPVFAILGILASFASIEAALVLFAFPTLFNAIPGTLDLTEKLFGLDFGK